jgi:carboxymethylenebutenolidase
MAKPDKTAAAFEPAVLEAFHDYVHGGMSRREFLDRVSKYAAGGMTASALLASLSPDYARAQDVAPDDPRIVSEYVNYPSPLQWQGYLVKPANINDPLPAVLVVHENRGRNPYIDDVVRRLGIAGFLAMGPDALSPMGGWPGNDDDGRAMQASLDGEEMFEHWLAAYEFLKSHPDSNGKVGVVGFCYGGGVVNRMAATLPDMAAGVAYYGRQIPSDQAANIRGALMIHNASLDTGIMAGAAAFDDALKAAGVDFESYVYQDVNHGFHNNSTPRFDEAAADLSWQRTLAFFNRHLR